MATNMELHKELNIILATELFAHLSAADQDAIIAQIKSLLSEQQ